MANTDLIEPSLPPLDAEETLPPLEEDLPPLEGESSSMDVIPRDTTLFNDFDQSTLDNNLPHDVSPSKWDPITRMNIGAQQSLLRLSPEQEVDFLKKRGFDSEIVDGRVVYRDEQGDRHYLNAPGMSWEDVGGAIPDVVRIGTQIAAAPLTATGAAFGNIPGALSVMGTVGAATEVPLNWLGTKMQGYDPGLMDSAKSIGMGGLEGAGGEIVSRLGRFGLGAAKDAGKYGLAKLGEKAPGVEDAIKEAASFTGKKLGEAVTWAGKNITSYKPQEIFKIIRPTLSKLRPGHMSAEDSTLLQSVTWLDEHMPHSLMGSTAEEINSNAVSSMKNIGEFIGNVYKTIDENELVPKLKWGQIDKAIAPIKSLAEAGSDTSISPGVRELAKNFYDGIKMTFGGEMDEEAIMRLGNKFWAPIPEGRGIKSVWDVARWAEQQINFEKASGKILDTDAERVSAVLSDSFRDLISELVPDNAVRGAVWGRAQKPLTMGTISENADLQPTFKLIQKISKNTGDSMLETMNNAYHSLASVVGTANRAVGAEINKNVYAGGQSLYNIPKWIRGMGTVAGTAGGVLGMGGSPTMATVAGALTGAGVAAKDIYQSTPSLLLRRAIQTGTLPESLAQSLSNSAPIKFAATTAKAAQKAGDALADFILQNPTAQEYILRSTGKTLVDWFEEFSNAAEPKAQLMLDKMKAAIPGEFQDDPKQVSGEEVSMYHKKATMDAIQGKLSTVAAYRRINSLMKEGKLA